MQAHPCPLWQVFDREMQLSPQALPLEQRLQQAYAMIASGEASVAVAAFKVGYTPAHFSGLFRKRFGIAPSALR